MSRVRTPFAPLYHTVVPLAGLVFRIKSGFVPDRRAQMPRKGPFVLLSNHASNYDFLYAFPQVWPRRMNAVVSQHFFGTRFLGWLLRVMGCIPIKQFTSDPSAVRDILAVIRAGRGLLLFPEAEVSGQGRSGPFLPSLPRLLKKLKALVYFMQICGAYLTAPKWAKTLRRGRVETQIFQLFSADALARASEAEISDALMGALRYDESEWQQTARIPFKGRRLAEGLHNMLHRCPRC